MGHKWWNKRDILLKYRIFGHIESAKILEFLLKCADLEQNVYNKSFLWFERSPRACSSIVDSRVSSFSKACTAVPNLMSDSNRSAKHIFRSQTFEILFFVADRNFWRKITSFLVFRWSKTAAWHILVRNFRRQQIFKNSSTICHPENIFTNTMQFFLTKPAISFWLKI